MIGTVNCGVAVGATAVEILDGTKRLWLCRVAAAVVAAVANARHARLQQLRIARAMRFVAVRAVFHYRGMLPDERSAALRVATQAILVRRALDQLLGIRRAMGIVAAGAGHFSFAIRHVRGSLQLRAPHLMALQAEFRLSFFDAGVFGQRRVVACLIGERGLHFLLYLVAVHARHSAGLMRTAFPEQVSTARMT